MTLLRHIVFKPPSGATTADCFKPTQHSHFNTIGHFRQRFSGKLTWRSPTQGSPLQSSRSKLPKLKWKEQAQTLRTEPLPPDQDQLLQALLQQQQGAIPTTPFHGPPAQQPGAGSPTESGPYEPSYYGRGPLQSRQLQATLSTATHGSPKRARPLEDRREGAESPKLQRTAAGRANLFQLAPGQGASDFLQLQAPPVDVEALSASYASSARISDSASTQVDVGDAGHLRFAVEAAARELRGPDGRVVAVPVTEATLFSKEVLYTRYIRKDLGLGMPCLPESLADAQALIASIDMGSGNRWALVTCAKKEVKDWLVYALGVGFWFELGDDDYVHIKIHPSPGPSATSGQSSAPSRSGAAASQSSAPSFPGPTARQAPAPSCSGAQPTPQHPFNPQLPAPAKPPAPQLRLKMHPDNHTLMMILLAIEHKPINPKHLPLPTLHGDRAVWEPIARWFLTKCEPGLPAKFPGERINIKTRRRDKRAKAMISGNDAWVTRLFTQFLPGALWFDFGEGGWVKVQLVNSEEDLDCM